MDEREAKLDCGRAGRRHEGPASLIHLLLAPTTGKSHSTLTCVRESSPTTKLRLSVASTAARYSTPAASDSMDLGAWTPLGSTSLSIPIRHPRAFRSVSPKGRGKRSWSGSVTRLLALDQHSGSIPFSTTTSLCSISMPERAEMKSEDFRLVAFDRRAQSGGDLHVRSPDRTSIRNDIPVQASQRVHNQVSSAALRCGPRSRKSRRGRKARRLGSRFGAPRPFLNDRSCAGSREVVGARRVKPLDQSAVKPAHSQGPLHRL